MISIIVNDTYLDLFPDTKFAINYKFFEPSDTTLRYGTFTNRIEIPRTNKNEVCFNFYGESKVSIDYDRIPCKVLSNGLEILPYGFIIIAKSDKKKYQLDLIDGFVDLYQIIEGKSIKDILYIQSGWPFALPSPMTNADIQGYANTSSGVMCPVMDYGKYVPENVDITTYLPGFSYRTVFERIFYDAGYTFAGDFRNDIYFLNRFIPYGNDRSRFEQPVGAVTPSFSVVSDLNVISGSYTVTNAELAARTALKFDFLNSLSSNTKGFFDGVSRITFPSLPVPASFDVDGNAINNPTSPGVIYRVRITLDFTVSSNTGSAVDVYVRNLTRNIDAYNRNLPAGASSGQTTSGDIDILPGDVFEFQIIRNAGAPGNIVFTLGRFLVTSYNQPAPYILPDISQKEFLKEANIWFGLIWKQTLQDRFEAKSLQEIISDRGNAVDWTSKRVSDESIDYGNSKYAQQNFYKFKVNNETIGVTKPSESLGLGVVSLINRIITKVKTIYNSIWYATLSSSPGGSFGKMARIPTFVTSSSRTTFDNAPVPRILMTRQFSGGGSVTYTTGVSTFKKAFFDDIDDSIPSGTYYNNSFQTALSRNYQLFFEGVKNFKSITRKYNLNDLDIATLDPQKLVFDNQEYFILMEVKNYQPGKISTVKLFKV